MEPMQIRTCVIAAFLLTGLVLFSTSACHAQGFYDMNRETEEWLETVPDRYRPLYKPGFSKEAKEEFRAGLDITAITMERTGCLGTCPAYELTFHIDGTADWEGIYSVEPQGEWSGEIDIWNYGHLCYLIDTIGFQKMENRYAATWTDDTSLIITVTYRDGTSKHVISYGEYGPIEVWGLGKSIDAVRHIIEWNEVPGD